MKFAHRTRVLWLVGASLAFSPWLRAADDVMKPAAPAAAVHFVSASRLELREILPPPPAPGSLADRADLETVRQVQAARTPDQVAWAKVVEKNDVFEVFGAGGLLGPGFTAENFPLLLALLKDINDDLRPLVDAAKKQYARPRPYTQDTRIQPCVERPHSDSYPSGHTYNGTMRAAVLAEIFPEHRAELQERARALAWARVIGGVHFPTDLEGGRRLAEAGFAALIQSPAFRSALEKCRAEAAAARKKAT